MHQHAGRETQRVLTIGPGHQDPVCNIQDPRQACAMQPVIPANYITELAPYPLPCKTSARNAVVPRWLGIANMRENGREKKVLKGAKVVIRFGQGWSLLFGYSSQEVMQNTPLVLRGVTAEEVTDMLRVTFNVHWDWEKRGRNGFPNRGKRDKKL